MRCISIKRWIYISVANQWLPHTPFFPKPFPCLSQLSRPSAVCFLLTFSSFCSDTPGSAADGAWPVGVGRQPALARNFQFQLDLTEGGSHYPYTEVGSEKNTPAVSWNSPQSTTSSNHMCRCMSFRVVDSAVSKGDAVKQKNKQLEQGEVNLCGEVDTNEAVFFFQTCRPHLRLITLFFLFMNYLYNYFSTTSEIN